MMKFMALFSNPSHSGPEAMDIDTENWAFPIQLAPEEIVHLQVNAPSSQSSPSSLAPSELASPCYPVVDGCPASSPILDNTTRLNQDRTLVVYLGSSTPNSNNQSPSPLLPNPTIVPLTPQSQLGYSRWKTIKPIFLRVSRLDTPP
jgi:hypothetical protein